jgi:hypothetical protein
LVVGLVGKLTEGTTPWELEINVFTGGEVSLLICNANAFGHPRSVFPPSTRIEMWVPWPTVRAPISSKYNIFPLRQVLSARKEHCYDLYLSNANHTTDDA